MAKKALTFTRNFINRLVIAELGLVLTFLFIAISVGVGWVNRLVRGREDDNIVLLVYLTIFTTIVAGFYVVASLCSIYFKEPEVLLPGGNWNCVSYHRHQEAKKYKKFASFMLIISTFFLVTAIATRDFVAITFTICMDCFQGVFIKCMTDYGKQMKKTRQLENWRAVRRRSSGGGPPTYNASGCGHTTTTTRRQVCLVIIPQQIVCATVEVDGFMRGVTHGGRLGVESPPPSFDYATASPPKYNELFPD